MDEVFQSLISQMATVDVVLKGILIGIVASAPMGPVGVLCIQIGRASCRERV